MKNENYNMDAAIAEGKLAEVRDMSKSAPVKASVMHAEGTAVTTVCDMGGIGYGYKLKGLIFKNGGNGWYYLQRDCAEYLADGGNLYEEVIRNRVSFQTAYAELGFVEGLS